MEYGKEKPHHIWCNFANKDGPCKQCDRLYQQYPPIDDPKLMIETYFPDVTVVMQSEK
jgi:hypothetical protein